MSDEGVKNTAGRRTDSLRVITERWYDPAYDGEEQEQERANRVMTVANIIWQRMAPYRTMWAACARNYGDAAPVGLAKRDYRQAPVQARNGRLSLNLTKSVCDSYVALVTEDQPKVTFLTNDGNAALQAQAKEQEKFVDGVVYDQNLHSADTLLQGNVAKYGTAWEFYWDRQIDPKLPGIDVRQHPVWCVLVDDVEAQIGRLRNLCLIEFIDRQELLEGVQGDDEAADQKRAKIRSASATAFDMGTSADGADAQIQDMVAVIHAWHLPRTTESGDGRYCKSLGNVVIAQSVYSDADFPGEPLYRLPPGEGIWGSPLADELRGIQRSVNTKTQAIERGDHLLGAGHWLIPNGAHINTNAIDNQIGSMIRHDPGMAPTFVSVNPTPETTYAERDKLYEYAYQLIGISPMTANGVIPPGVHSGRAIRQVAGVQQTRFKPCYGQYQDFWIRRTKQILKLAAKIAKRSPNWEVKAAGKDMMATVRVSEALLDDNLFTLKLYPTNALANDPAERIDQVQEIQGLSPAMKRLLDYPDLAAEASYDNASFELTMKCATRILDGKEYVGPEVYMDLTEAIKRMQLVRVKARLDGVDDAKLRLLQNWIQQAVELRESPEFAAMNPPPPVPPGAVPPGAPPLRAAGAPPLPQMPPGMPAQPMPTAA